ncbi:hypothetical protein [Mycobacteroides abscessus]|uniref:hypothetical protein n=1 Tax=Mycobacteroides abscessus TaxID=36809 RepID=UPI0013000CE5|nr:hypothetical protein [Mycobacteroides abscessus]
MTQQLTNERSSVCGEGVHHRKELWHAAHLGSHGLHVLDRYSLRAAFDRPTTAQNPIRIVADEVGGRISTGLQIHDQER